MTTPTPMRKPLRAAIAAGALALSTLFPAASALAQAPVDVKFTLDFIALGRHAPWYVGVAKGYYKDEGLNVTVMPSKGTADAIKAVESGIADIGFIDIPSLVATGATSSIKIVAVNYQKAPYCVFSLNPGGNVNTPKDMVGLEMASSTGSFVWRIHQAFMKMNGLDPATLKITNVDPSARVSMLVSGKLPAVDLFLMSEPSIKRAAPGKEVKCLLLGDHGLDIYANSIGATDAWLQKNPETMRKFVRASLRAWKDTMSNPVPSAKLQANMVKGLQEDIIAEEIAIVRRLAVVPDTEKNGYGWMNKPKMQRTVDFINNNIEVPGRKFTVDDIYRDGYLPKEPIRP